MPQLSPAALELAYWQSIENSVNPADYQAYLRKYPDGEFADIAQERIGDDETPPPQLPLQGEPVSTFQQQQAQAGPEEQVRDDLQEDTVAAPQFDADKPLQQVTEQGYLGLRFIGAQQKRMIRFNVPDPVVRLRLMQALTTPGALVKRVDVPSPAAAIGFLPGDVITAVNGDPITTPAQLNAHLRQVMAGESVSLSIARGERHATVRVTLTQMPAAEVPFMRGNMYASPRIAQNNTQVFRRYESAAARVPIYRPEIRRMSLNRRAAIAARMSRVAIYKARKLALSGP